MKKLNLTTKIIDHPQSYVNWIKNQSGLPWLMIDFEVPWRQMLKEVELLEGWIPYRNEGGNGWSSLAIHGRKGLESSVYHSNIKDDDYNWSIIADMCPVTKDFLQNKAGIIKHKKTRFMKVDPGGSIFLHHDRECETDPLTSNIKELGPLHFTIQNPDECLFHIPPWGTIPLKNGSTWFFSNVWEHEVINNSDKPRYHIICSGCDFDNEYWNPIIIKAWENVRQRFADVSYA